MIVDTGPRELFATELRKLRERSGRTLRELQTITFASDSALSRYFSGRSVPPWNVVAALCGLTRTDPERLRPLWQQAHARRRHTASNPDLQEGPSLSKTVYALSESIAVISAQIAEAIRAAHALGEAVPQHLLALQCSSADAATRLRTAQCLLALSPPTDH
ncbi:helix-turn-helix domain-containing protein [Actinoplanes sp. GCM10030250]|uniref:helix-turn-helix domain-containing protein n=1 Tax=Actinoplanes sp. GCM10030250 TaxID=3273376 RepID=UPI0036217C3F